MLTNKFIRTILTLAVLLAFAGGGYQAFTWIKHAQKAAKPADVLAIGLLDDTPPFCFYNSRNTLVGINIDLGKELARRLGMTARVESVSFNRLTSGLTTRQYDLISLGSITPHRARVIRYISPHLISSDVLLVHPRLRGVRNLAEFKGKPWTIGVYNGTSYIELLKKQHLTANMAIYPNQRDVFMAFYKHRVDAIMMNAIVAKDIQRRLDPTLVIATHVRDDRRYAFATRTADLKLWRRVDDAMRDMVADGTVDRIETQWTGNTSLRQVPEATHARH